MDINDHLDTEEIEALNGQMQLIKEVLSNFNQYEVIKSSYFKNYCYTMMNYQYLVDGVKNFQSVQLVQPIAKMVFDKHGSAVKEQGKTNIVFLDMERIQRGTSKISKKVQAYLESFPNKIIGGRRDLFIKKK